MKKIFLVISCSVLFINILKTELNINLNINSEVNTNPNNLNKTTDTINISQNISQEKTDTQINKKIPKIVILTSSGGNGHMSACKALQQVLPDCEIKIINFIHYYFNNIVDGDRLYDATLQKGWTRTINFIIRYPVPLLFKILGKSIQKNLLKILEDEKPDLLISVIPFFDFFALQAAEIYKIPFLIIPVDYDLTNWLLGMENSSNKKFTIAVETLTDRIQEQLKQKNIPNTYIHEVGYNLRKDFSIAKDLTTIRKEWNIPENKKVIMLIRGSTGSIKLVKYAEELIKLDKKVHLLICVGKNVKLIKSLNKIKNDGPVSFSIIPFTSKIPDLMAVSDLIITQPSPSVCKEAIFMKLPILIDMSDVCLFWEEATIDLIKLRGYGDIFSNMNQLNQLVNEYLDKRDFFKTQTQKPMPDFKTEVHNIVMRLLEK
ncbi:MAG: glycosyltransferase [Candidatus Babeliales bacterium]